MIRLLCNPVSAALPAGWKKNAGLAPASIYDARRRAGRRRSDAGTIDYGANNVSPNNDGLVLILASLSAVAARRGFPGGRFRTPTGRRTVV